MKTHFKLFLATFLSLGMMTMTSCKKDDIDDSQNPENPQNPQTEETTSLKGTAWVGIYNDTYTENGIGYPAVLTWNLDFLSDTSGSLYLEVKVNNMDQQPTDMKFTYTFNGTGGLLDFGQNGAAEYTYNAAEKTITIDLPVMVDESGNQTIGGTTIFHPRGENPGGDPGSDPGSDTTGGVTPGEITEDFPANTVWEASQTIDYPLEQMGGSIPVTLDYTLTYNNDHTGSIIITATALGQTGEPSAVLFNWEYDDAQSAGNFIIKGQPIPFHFNATDNTIETDLNLNVNDGAQAGGSLVFHRVQK